eukprot:3738564-Pyramimonas_sp.AAC.1
MFSCAGATGRWFMTRSSSPRGTRPEGTRYSRREADTRRGTTSSFGRVSSTRWFLFHIARLGE